MTTVATSEADTLAAAERAVADGLRNAATRSEHLRWTLVQQLLSRLRTQPTEGVE
jgi:hypothetical protein